MNKRVMEVRQANSSLHDCFELMRVNSILSLPIFQNGVCLGFVDNLDIIGFLLDAIQEVEEFTVWTPLKLRDVTDNIKLGSIVNSGKGDPLVISDIDSSLSVLLNMFSSGFAHRTLVSEGKDYYICSQSDIVKYLKDFDHPLKTLKLSDVVSGRRELVSVTSDTPLLVVFKKMIEKSVHGVVVVDPVSKVVVGNFSASDVRGLDVSMLNNFAMPVVDYLQSHSASSLKTETVSKDATYQQVLDTMCMKHLHRVWIVNDDNIPQGLWTLSDLISASLKK